jgi:hypothetical protein
MGMEKKNIYIDESGDTGYTKKSTRYFILTAVVVGDPFVLMRVVKNIYKFKLSKKRTSILHTYNEDNVVKNKLAKEMREKDLKCIVFILDKNKIFVKDPYRYLLNKIIIYFSTLKVTQITLAKRDTRKSYNKNIINLFHSSGMELQFSDPALEKSLQIADFYSWSVFSHLEYGYSVYFLKLKDQIILR